VSTFRLDSRFARFGFVQSIFGPDDPTLVSATAVQAGHDTAVSANLGAIWRSRNNRVSAGGTFRRGPRFTFTQQDHVLATQFNLTRVGRFKVPDVWAAGAAWTASDTLRVLVDYDRVQYSQLKADFIDFQAIASGRSSQLRIDNANEVHGGVEYRRNVGGRPVAWRIGGWFDPDHTVHYTPTAAGDEFDTLLSATLREGRNLVHYTGGIGVGLPKRAVLDAATDLSSRTRSVTASLLLRF
jgi:long-subunit fatty acid transport protein